MKKDNTRVDVVVNIGDLVSYDDGFEEKDNKSKKKLRSLMTLLSCRRILSQIETVFQELTTEDCDVLLSV